MPAANPTTSQKEKTLPLTNILLGVLVILSLALALLMTIKAIEGRRVARQALEQSAAILASLGSVSLQGSVVFEDQITLQDAITLQQSVSVPFQTTINISESVEIPVSIGGYGPYLVSVPIETQIPIDTMVVIPIEAILPIAVELPLSFEIPLSLDFADGSLGLALSQTLALVEELRAYLEDPLLP